MKPYAVLCSPLLKLLPLALVCATTTAALAEPYVPPAGLGAPGRRESAGTRGCVFGNPAHLIALMPNENVGLTTEPYPRFYWYMPVSQAQFIELTLSLVDEDGVAIAPLYTTRLAAPEAAGIVSWQLPESANLPPLTAGDRYRWQVAVFCNPQSEEGDLQIDGWVEYQPPSQGLQSALSMVTASDQVSLYTQNSYWFDALDELAILTAANPDDAALQTRWAELLNSVGLDEVVEQPFLTPTALENSGS